MQLLQRNLADQLAFRFRQAEHHIVIVSPYVGHGGVRLAIENISPQLQSGGRLSFLTDLSPRNVYQSSTDPTAVRALCNHFRKSRLRHLPNLHAKVYLVDDKAAIVTSGNLTSGGLYRNYEYGIEITRRKDVLQIRDDIDAYGDLGSTVDTDRLNAICSAADELRELYTRKLRSVQKRVADEFADKVRVAEDDLIRLRLAGCAMHTVFEKTVLYLLKRDGPLTTKQLHPIVATIHPDLCDDSIDRVIDGRHFGKKWKHAVRTAQQQLKRKGLIQCDRKLWKVC